jgi:MoxR-like ATPase
VHLPAPVAEFIGRLVEATHPTTSGAPESVRRFVRYGASPRAALAFAAAGRALALSKGKPNVGFDEVKELAGSVLSHRVVLGYEAALEKVGAARIVAELLEKVPEVLRA